jgi:hypothetical protein
MMGEHLLELDTEAELVEAFACFDEGDKGVVQVSEMRKCLGELGDRMEDWEVSQVPRTHHDRADCADRETVQWPFHGQTREVQLR